ncbi:beta strand repeat-containing protein [Terrimonas pollutisoli]|uniref:beta strand repeat-containing protein n=1 Tax=Terrimonas pollutisoli TaxID=3034147 RepID=UPI0023EB100B|nr:T9SS type A sorting domain-containing protein [Terrimonas sp. H1YJ31]
MKTNLLNSVHVKVSLLFAGVLFTATSFAQTTINNGQTVAASNITANTAIIINAGGTLDMDVSKSFTTLTTANAGTSAISGTGVLTLNTVTIAGGNDLSIAVPVTTTTLASATLTNQTSTVSGAGSISAGALTINGTDGNGATFAIGTGLTVAAASLSGGAGNNQTTYNVVVNGVLKIGGAIDNSIDNLTSNPGSTVEYTSNGNQTMFATAYNNLILSGTGTKSLPGAGGATTLAISGNVTIGTGVTFDNNNKSLTIAGNWTNDGSFTSGPGTITFSGNAAQVIGGTQPTSFRRIAFANTNGGISLTKPVTITESATFTSGIVTTDATNLLIFNDNATSSLVATNAATTSYVNGPVRKVGNDAFVFPVGKANGFVPIEIGAVGGAGNTFTAEYIRATAPNRTNITAAGIQAISSCEYWTLDRSAGTTAISLILHWNANSPCGGTYISDVQSMRAVHYNGTSWDAASTGFGAGTPAAGSVTWGSVSTFSPFALGTTDAAANPLPVVYANVKAYEKNKGVQVEWSNLTEKDVASYSVERSANGSDFSSVATQLPASNQNDKADYSAFDATPNTGVNYYRIKAVEVSGKVVYSQVLSVSLGKSGQALRLYPNPVTGNQVTISLSNLKNGQYNLRVLNTAGQGVYRQAINASSNTLTQTLELPSTIKPGVYNLVVIGDTYRESKMFIVQ